MNPLIIALDVESVEDARGLVRRIGDSASFYKVGLELFTGAGPEIVRELVAEGKRVFLDLKMYDIHETVKRAASQAARLGATFLTVHAQSQTVRAAAEGKAGSDLRILAVTVLTSLDAGDLARDGHTEDAAALVERRTRNAVEAGTDGIVCSPLEVARVRAIAGAKVALVVPGVRSAGASAGDQKRVATPAQAMKDGADYLVVGRQVTRATDPKAEVARIMEEIYGKALIG
jgi:orotidine-5'-phosphate decarboxylase